MQRPKLLQQELFLLLKEVGGQRCPELSNSIQSRNLSILSVDKLERLEEEVAHELMSTGIEDGELNERGLLLDDLIGEIVMTRIEKEEPS